MQQGKRAALAVAFAGLLAAGTAGVTLAQADADGSASTTPAAPASPALRPGSSPQAAPLAPDDGSSAQPGPSTQMFLLVPVDPSAAAPGASDDEGNGDATEGSQPDASGGAGDARQPTLILIPLPQDDDAAPGDDDHSHDDDSSGSGSTLIVVPQSTPHALPAGVLEA